METCIIDRQKPATVICSCQKVPLCQDHILTHTSGAGGRHVTCPIEIYQKMTPWVYNTRRDKFEQCVTFIKQEQQYMNKISQYKSDLKSRIEMTKQTVCEELDNLYDYKVELLSSAEKQVQENLDSLIQKGELHFQSNSLVYDLEQSVESLVDTFVFQISRQYAIEYKSIQLATPIKMAAQADQVIDKWTWSETLTSLNMQISEDGKTISPTDNCYVGAMIDLPMSEGKYNWKIQLDKMNSGGGSVRIGVAERSLDMNSSFTTKSFWGFEPNYVQKFVKGEYNTPWGKKAKEGDVIEVQLEFIENKGTLSFLLNGKSLGVLCDNLDAPLYPAAQLYSVQGHQMSLVE